ncbi:hypothetical protein N9K95_02730 [Schleiferiaceae bacterium]|nr:hypothetical protein [Schleiferiaceae bacterium]
MRRLIIGVLFCLSVIKSSGQTSIAEERFLRFKALERVYKYAEKATLETRMDENAFLELFSLDAEHFNDILPMNNQDSTWSVEDYVQKNYRVIDPLETRIEPEIQSIRLFRSSLGEGVIRVQWKKYIYSIGNESRRIYEDTLNLEMEMSYSDSLIQIQKVILIEPAVDYYFFDMKSRGRGKKATYASKDFNQVLVNLDTISIKQDGEVFIRVGSGESDYSFQVLGESDYIGRKKFKIENLGGEMGNSIEPFSNFSTIRMKRKSMYLSVGSNLSTYVSPTTFGEGHVGVLQGSDVVNKVNLGLILLNSRQRVLQTRMELGYSYGINSYDIVLNAYKESFNSEDSDAHGYHRIVQIKDLQEAGIISRSMISGSVKSYYGFKIPKGLKIFTGFHYSHLLGASYEYNSSATITYSGVYGSEFCNIVIQENGVYDFGEHLVNTEYIGEFDPLKYYFGLELGLNYELLPRLEFEPGFLITRSNVGQNDLFNKVTRDPFEIQSMYLNTIRGFTESLSFGLKLNYYIK